MSPRRLLSAGSHESPVPSLMAISRSGTHFAVSGTQNKRKVSIHPYPSVRDGVFPSRSSSLALKLYVRRIQARPDRLVESNASAASSLRPLRNFGYHGLLSTIRGARLSCKNNPHPSRWRWSSVLGYRNYEDYVPYPEVSRIAICDNSILS